MIGAFTFNGISSSTYDLICKSVKRPILPPLRSNITKIPASSTIYDATDGHYDLMNLIMKIQYVGKDTGGDSAYYELRQRAKDIATWLGSGWGELTIEGDPVSYTAKVESEIELVTTFTFAEADISFICFPAGYGMVISVSA